LTQFLIPLLAAFAASILGGFWSRVRIPVFFAYLSLALICWLGLACSQWTITRWPDLFDSATFFPKQVWQRIIWPLGIVMLGSVVVESLGTRLRGDTRLILYVVSFGWMIFASLPFAPIWDDLIGENAFWLLASSTAAICNFQSLSRMLDRSRSESGHRWAMWAIVANYGAIAGVLFSQIGSLGEWCFAVTIMATVIASAISWSGKSEWMKPLLPGFCLLSACLIANIRFNASQAKPWWIFLGLYFMVSGIAWVDLLAENRLCKRNRLIVSTIIGTIASLSIVGSIWMNTVLEEEW